MLNAFEKTLIIDALKTELRNLNRIMQDLERQQLHNGNQNVSIQNKMHDLNDLIKKMTDNRAI